MPDGVVGGSEGGVDEGRGEDIGGTVGEALHVVMPVRNWLG